MKPLSISCNLQNSYLLSFFMLITLMSNPLEAQVFPSQDATWQGVTYGIAGPIPYRNAICGDTLINTQIYHKLYFLYEDEEGGLQPTYRMAIRTDDLQVWCVELGENTETLLYDFSLGAGDQIKLKLIDYPDSVSIKVADVTTISIDGNLRKVLNFVPVSGIEESWIEGIGSTKGPTQRGFTAVDADSDLQCFRENGILIYRNVPQAECDFIYECALVSDLITPLDNAPDFKLYPTVTTSRVYFENNSRQVVTIQVNDLSGTPQLNFKKLPPGLHELNLHQLSPGIYFFTVKDTEKNIYLQGFRIIISE